MKKMIPLALVALFAAACSSFDANSEQLPSSVSSEFRQFIDALISKDEAEISSRYLDHAPSFTENGKLNKEIYNFLYKDSPGIGKKTVQEIIGDGEYFFKVIPQSDAVYTVIITPMRNKEKLENLSFLYSSWMVEYVACEFEVSGGKISLYHNVCFAETDGPFPRESVF